MEKYLKPREQKLFEMLLNGIPPKEIAHNLGVTYNALLYHQKQLYRKLGVHSVRELVEKYAPAAKGEAAGTIAPESGQTMPQPGPQLVASTMRGSPLAARKKTLPFKWCVIFGIVLLAVVLLFVLFFIRKPTDEGHPAVFNRWNTWTDKTGSSIDVTVTYDDSIEGEHFASYTMSGVLSGAEGWYTAGIILYPVPLTLQAMKRIKSFSFKVLGDGQPYKVQIATTDTQLGEHDTDHYKIMFPTIIGQISTITINTDDLMQQGYGKQVPFIRDNIISMEFMIQRELLAESSEPFHLKVWDIRIF